MEEKIVYKLSAGKKTERYAGKEVLISFELSEKFLTLMPVTEWLDLKSKLVQLDLQEKISFTDDPNDQVTIQNFLNYVKVDSEPEVIKAFKTLAGKRTWIGADITANIREELAVIAETKNMNLP